MRQIATIITAKNASIDTFPFVKVTNDIKYAVDGPILVVGYNFVKHIFPNEKISVLNKRIDNNIQWIFSKTEKRNEYEEGLTAFNNMLIKNILDNVKYTNYTIYSKPLSTLKRFINFIDSKKEKIIYVSDKHVFIFFDKDKICGLSITECEYYGVNRNRIIERLSKNKYNRVYTNKYEMGKRVLDALNGEEIVIPYLFYLKNT